MSNCECPDTQLGLIYDPDKVGAEEARKCDWRLLFFTAIGALSGYGASYQTREKSDPRVWALVGAAAGVASAFYLNHAVGAGLCAPKNPTTDGLGNLWQMPQAPPNRASEFMPPIGQPGGTEAWRMPVGTQAGYHLPDVGSVAEPQQAYMPASFTPAPIPTPLRATWADVMS